MADRNEIFISYAKGDRAHAQEFSDWLQSYGFKVWWDRELLAGQDYPQELERIIHESKCIVVLWSENSVKSRWVYQEAELGSNAGKLVPALVDISADKIPIGMRTTHATDFKDREGLLKAMQVIVQSPAVEVRVRSFLAQRLDYLLRRGRRMATPLRLTFFAEAVIIMWLFYHDFGAWRSVQHSTNRRDFENYLSSASFRFHAHSARDRMDEIDAFMKAIQDNDFHSYRDVFQAHSSTLYSKIAQIAYDRYTNNKGASLVFEDTNKRLLNDSDISTFDCDRLRLVRNQIFYRRGYCFTSDLGISVLPNEDCPTQCDEVLAINDAVSRSLREIETKNVDFIKHAEKTRFNGNECASSPKPRCSATKN